MSQGKTPRARDSRGFPECRSRERASQRARARHGSRWSCRRCVRSRARRFSFALAAVPKNRPLGNCREFRRRYETLSPSPRAEGVPRHPIHSPRPPPARFLSIPLIPRSRSLGLGALGLLNAWDLEHVGDSKGACPQLAVCCSPSVSEDQQPGDGETARGGRLWWSCPPRRAGLLRNRSRAWWYGCVAARFA
jgi:hypothetical protein